MLALRSLTYIVFGFGTIIIGGIIALLTFWAPRRFHWWLCTTWSRMAMWGARAICDIDCVVEGREHVPAEPSVIMIKHTTTYETFWQITEFPRTAWVIKREILWMPFFGWAIALVLSPIAIDRGAGGRAVKQVIRQGMEKLENGIWVTIFPEGTRMPPGETRRYGISGAALAKEAGVKIVPVAHNAGDLWPKRSFIKKPGTVLVRIGPPIDAADRPPRETSLIVQQWIETQMHEISSVYRDKYRQPHPDYPMESEE